jgi:hypothetical protein
MIQSNFIALPKVYGEAMGESTIQLPNLTRVPNFYLHGSCEGRNGYDIFKGDSSFVAMAKGESNFLVDLMYSDGTTEICLCVVCKHTKEGYIISLTDLTTDLILSI